MYNNDSTIVALERKNSEPQWNNNTIRWTILELKPDQPPKSYDINFDMIYISSKRIIKVNGEKKH